MQINYKYYFTHHFLETVCRLATSATDNGSLFAPTASTAAIAEAAVEK
jgi:hypothetical protein